MCWHEWNKWTETAKGELFKYPDVTDLSKKVHIGQVSYQERVCQKCGRKDLYCAVARISPDYDYSVRAEAKSLEAIAES